MSLSKISGQVIDFSFYLLFFSVPLFWLPLTSELFEFNKMILFYFLTTVIMAAWLIKGLVEKKLVIKRTVMDLPILLFLAANILSTIFSLDPHTSIFGYYGRWNGGLLSTFAYILLFYALVSNTGKKQAVNYIWTIIISGFAVAFYGILQHPNPLFHETVAGNTVYHGIDYKYWAVDVENRVFSTLGQPNWLAALLAMTIFPTLSLLLIVKPYWQKILAFIALAVSYIAFTFTYSRGGTVGLLLGLATFAVLFPLYRETLINRFLKLIPVYDLNLIYKKFRNYFLVFLAILVLILSVNQFFGNALSRRGGLEVTTSSVSSQSNSTTNNSPQTQLEVGGNQTATIRTIVWTGSIEIFKHFPVFGTGVETFGYSYYLFRPASHNLTVEWDYLYNKAHNEYLNYLATTGAVGFLSYLFLIGLFEFFAIKLIVNSDWSDNRFFSLGLLSAYNTYLAQNFFGFSVVPIAVLFFTIPAIFLIINDKFKAKDLVIFTGASFNFIDSKLNNYILRFVVVLIFASVMIFITSMWLADYFYNQATNSEDYQSAIQDLRISDRLLPNEPIYQAELALNLSGLAQATSNKTTAKDSAKEAREIINQAVKDHPNNTDLWQTKRQVDFNLSKYDKVNYLELLRSAETLKKLAPTDASIQYDIALVYSFVDEPKQAEKQLETVVKLKPDYSDAVLMLARVYKQNGKVDQAKKIVSDWLKTHQDDIQFQELQKTL